MSSKEKADYSFYSHTGESPNEWYEREKAAFNAWWESDGEKTFSGTPTLAAGAGWFARAESATPVVDDPLSPGNIIAASKQEAEPVKELCAYIKDSIRLCDHGYIHITCGQCVATWMRG